MKKTVFFPGRVNVVFRKGPLGFLRQDPSDEARRIEDDPSMRDRSAPMKEESVRQNALTVVRVRGGDATDPKELLGEYIIQFGKYKGKSFRWLLENDMGYTLYLIQSHQREETAGTVVSEGHSKDSLMSFLRYALSFQVINSLLQHEAQKRAVPTPAAEDDQQVGFGARANSTWREIWESRADGYAAFILKRKCAPGTKMHKLQQYLQKRQQLSSSSVTSSPVSSTPVLPPPASSAEPMEMEEDEELERAMLSISTVTEQTDMPAQSVPIVLEESGDAVPAAVPLKSPLPLPQELKFLLPEARNTSAPETLSHSDTPPTALIQPDSEPSNEDRPQTHPAILRPVQPTAAVNRPPPPPLPTEQELSEWNCSHQQKIWMKMELESMGLWPGSRPVTNLMKTFSLWRLPPQPELIDSVHVLPSPKYFHLHPFFIWKPESDYLMARLKNNYSLPCSGDCAQPSVVSAGVGRPRVIVGLTGQYYLLSSRLCCQRCRRRWYADNPLWLEKLPQRFTNLLPAVLTYKKAICKSVLDELRRTGKSPNDMTNQITEMLHLKYERANLAYLLSCQNVMDGEAGAYGQKTITQFLRQETTPVPEPFGGYSDSDGWRGVSVSSHYLTDCLLHEFKHQKDIIHRLLQGTFGQALRSDHTRKVARKVTFSSGAMSSYAVMNENWMILSWAMVQSETDKSLTRMYQGLSNRYSRAGIDKAQYQWVDRDCCAAFRVAESVAGEHLTWGAWGTTDAVVAEATSGNLLNACASRTHYNSSITIKLDLFHCMRRFLRECVSEHHPLYSSFAQFLSAAFSVVDQDDLQRLKDAYAFCGIRPANPTKQHIREHCRVKIPQPGELVQRVEGVFKHFYTATDPNGVSLFKPSMLKTWRIQRVHILRGCLSDPEVEGGTLYRQGGTIQLNHMVGEPAKVPVWIPIRGTSQQEGYHFHQAQWVTGTQVSPELFQAQGLTGVCRWNYQRLVDMKQPGVHLPPVFDPALIHSLNTVSKRVVGVEKYPALYLSAEDTGERFGLEYTEPDCRPVPLDWNKHKSRKDTGLTTAAPSTSALSAAKSEPGPSSSSAPSRLFSLSSVNPVPRTTATATTTTAAATAPTRLFRFSSRNPSPCTTTAATAPTAAAALAFSVDSDAKPRSTSKSEPTPLLLPLPIKPSPSAARTGPVKTGGRVFVLDHKRWPAPMKAVIDGLLNKHRGQKDMLKLVDQEYATLVHNSSSDPNSLLHPTTRLHISQYIKHTCKQLNTSSSLNTSPEKLEETQTLWQSLTAGSTTVPVVTMPPATVNPPPPALSGASSLTQHAIEKIVLDIMEKQQHQQQQPAPELKKPHTKKCLSCGQPKSKYEGDGSSIHEFYQKGPVRYFYCSKKVFDTYGAEGLTDPRMPFRNFVDTEFFQRELEATRQRVEEKQQQKRKREEEQQKRKREESPAPGRKCRFCKHELKQGPNSPHIHTGFPGVPGKYVYCPAKVFSLYREQGMEREMSWEEFKQSPFFEKERQRWVTK